MLHILFSLPKTFNVYFDINNLCAMYQNKPPTMGILKLFYDEIVIAADIPAEVARIAAKCGQVRDAKKSVSVCRRRLCQFHSTTAASLREAFIIFSYYFCTS